MKTKNFALWGLMVLALATTAAAGSFRIQYPSGTDLFVVDKQGNISAAMGIKENNVWLNQTYLKIGGKTGNTTEEIQDAAWAVTGGTQTHITVTYQDGTNDVDFEVSDDWWDADNDIADDGISEKKIMFNSTTCAAGNYLYINSNNLACLALPSIETITWDNLTDAPLGGMNLTAGTVENSRLANTSITFSADDDGTAVALGGTVTLNGGTNGIDTVNTAGTIVFNFDWSEVANDAVAEAKIDFDTACASGNHLYVSGNDLACEPDSGGVDVYVNETGDSMSGSLVMGAGANLNLSATSKIVSDGTNTYAQIDSTGNFLVVLG